MKNGRSFKRNKAHFALGDAGLVLVAACGCLVACANPLADPPPDPAKVEEARKAAEALKAAEEKERLASEMEGLVKDMAAAMARLDSDASFDEPDLKALQSNVDREIQLLNEHPEIANGKAVELGSFLVDLRAFLEGVKIGTVDVDARTGAQTGQRMQNGNELRLDVVAGEWTSKKGSGDWPPNPGTGYANYRPGILSDYRSCLGVAMGALVGSAGQTCFPAGTSYVYKGSPDILSFKMNDAYPDDNGGLLTVRWRLFTKPAPDVSKFRLE